jgi:hypothetical protein
VLCILLSTFSYANMSSVRIFAVQATLLSVKDPCHRFLKDVELLFRKFIFEYVQESLSIVSDHRLDDGVSIPSRGKGFFLPSVSSLLCNGYQRSFPLE